MERYKLYIIKDSNDTSYEEYEIYDTQISRVVKTTKDFDEVEIFFGFDIPRPEVVIVG